MNIFQKLTLHRGSYCLNRRSIGLFSSSLHQSKNLQASLKHNEAQIAERSDSLKYTYLDGQQQYDKIYNKLHPDLVQGLKVNNYTYQTHIQDLAIKNGILEGKNLIISSETGTGKTLAYLLPILNQLFLFKDHKSQLNKSAKFRMNKSNEEQMFLHAEEIQHKAKKEHKRLSFNKSSDGETKGAIIISYSKELLNQIYAQARKLDVNERLLINRATSSLQMKTPIVELITPDKTKGEKETDENELFEISLKNVFNNASWKITDILLATPVVMSHIIDNKDKYDPYDINPAVIVIDEYDELLQNQGVSQHIQKIMRKFASFQDKGNPLAQVNRTRQFIFTGATIPKSITSGHDAIQTLQDWIPGIEHIRTDNCHKVSQLLEYQWIDLEKAQHLKPKSETSSDTELNILVDVVKRSLDVLRSKSIMIFADSKKSVDRISEAMLKAGVRNLPYYQDIGVYGRQTTLQLFFNGELPVLVCTNLAARGLDTMHVDHVIQFDFAKNVVDYIHRVGRTGRMGQKGYVTNFIRRADYDLEQRIRELEENNEAFDKIISKKKPSGSKKNPKKGQNANGDEEEGGDEEL